MLVISEARNIPKSCKFNNIHMYNVMAWVCFGEIIFAIFYLYCM